MLACRALATVGVALLALCVPDRVPSVAATVAATGNAVTRGLTPSGPRGFAWRPLWPSRPRAGRRRRPRALPDPPDASPGPPELRVQLFSCNFHRILLFSALSGHGGPTVRSRWSDQLIRGIP